MLIWACVPHLLKIPLQGLTEKNAHMEQSEGCQSSCLSSPPSNLSRHTFEAPSTQSARQIVPRTVMGSLSLTYAPDSLGNCRWWANRGGSAPSHIS